MSALAYFLEDEGIATTGISLVREHTEQMRPPRFLWVPFPLGRPLGVPGDPAFQHDVIAAALNLLDAASGPVLLDYERDAPASAEPEESWSCPVSFAQPQSASPSLTDEVQAEIRELSPWYTLSQEQRGRTTVGASGLSIDEAFALVAEAAALDDADADDFDVIKFKYAIEDLKAYYLEAAATSPGADINVNAWLWRETALTRLVREIASTHHNSSNVDLKTLIASGFVPREFS